MLVNLIEGKQMFSVSLPSKSKGQFWIKDLDNNGLSRQLISIEAIDGNWVMKSNNTAIIYDDESQKNVDSAKLIGNSFFRLRIKGTSEKAYIFVENEDVSRINYNKYSISGFCQIGIGKLDDNLIVFNDPRVSRSHATLIYDNGNWYISDTNSKNGTYVNGLRIGNANLRYGDCVFIMGLRIVVGNGFFAINNPDGLVKVVMSRCENVRAIVPQEIKESSDIFAENEPEFFYRSPVFHDTIKHEIVKIDSPPQKEKIDSIPMAYMIGPSMTMGMTSLTTGMISAGSAFSNGGGILQALPTLLMSGSMMASAVLWPILTKKHEHKLKLEAEEKRRKRYTEYLEVKRDSVKAIAKIQKESLHSNYVSTQECLRRIANKSPELWERVIGQPEFLKLRLGLGNIPVDVSVEYNKTDFSLSDDGLLDEMYRLGGESRMIENVPVTFSLIEEKVVGVIGEQSCTISFIQQMIVQMISLHSYDELKIMILFDESDYHNWSFIKFIPHFWNDEHSIRFFASSVEEAKELSTFIDTNIVSRGNEISSYNKEVLSPHYVIISSSKSLLEKCDGLQRLLLSKKDCGASILVAAPESKNLPKETQCIINVGPRKSEIIRKNDPENNVEFLNETLNPLELEGVSTDISNIRLDCGSKNFNMPSMITFLEMFGVGKIEHLNVLTRWRDNIPTSSLKTPIGVDISGNSFYLDLHEKYHGPHGLVAGMTGSGKSEFVITYILSMAINYHPDEVAFILIDYKGGGLAGAFDNGNIRLPHLAGTITNLDGSSVNRSLLSIQSELRRRQRIFKEACQITKDSTMDIYKYQQYYRERIVSEPIPHLFIISDEFAELKSQQPDFMEQLISTARIGRSLGIHLILATQKPSGVVNEQIWSNSKFKVCLKVQDRSDSQEMIKKPDAASLIQTGRFYLQVGYDEFFALGQSAWSGAEYFPSETLEKTLDSSVQIIDNLGHDIFSVKNKTTEKKGTHKSQVYEIVTYLSKLAHEEKISTRQLWLPSIPSKIFVDDLEKKYGYNPTPYVLNPVVGEYDDPYNQSQNILTLPLTDGGHCLIYGSAGNGKTTYLTTLCYSIAKNHTPDEVNIYIMDFGGKTLFSFAEMPHVGDVMSESDDDKIKNCFTMLLNEISKRKEIFAMFGGDYISFIKHSMVKVPNIVLIINNWSGFYENFSDYQDYIRIILNEGTKYGVYLIVTANATNSVSFSLVQSFKTTFTMQLNDESEYSFIVGRTSGLVPSKFKGRGLIRMDNLYEFQTAYCSNLEDTGDFIRKTGKELAAKYNTKAPEIKVLPKYVAAESFNNTKVSASSVPLGYYEKNVDVVSFDFTKQFILPVASTDFDLSINFANEFAKLAAMHSEVITFDYDDVSDINSRIIKGKDFDKAFVDLFEEMVERYNTWYDDNLAAEKYTDKTIIFVGFNNMWLSFSDDFRDKLNVIISNTNPSLKMHYVFAGERYDFTNYMSAQKWYDKLILKSDGLWIGPGFANQDVFKAKTPNALYYKDIGENMAYYIHKGKYELFRVISSDIPEEEI